MREIILFFFFFSSRRRHTRLTCDWSSDVCSSDLAEFGIDWLPSLLASRDKGQDLVNIAQVFTRSGMTELTWKDSNITTIDRKSVVVGKECRSRWAAGH